MGLIDKENLIMDIDSIIFHSRALYGEDPLLYRAINLIRDTRDFVAQRDVLDPIHYAGGCYCWECEYYGNKDKHPAGGDCLWWERLCFGNDFCSYGYRREDADG